MVNHVSHEEPPDKPFFRLNKPSVVKTQTQPVSISPRKKLNRCTELINQLQMWYQLLYTGYISQAQCAELKNTILLASPPSGKFHSHKGLHFLEVNQSSSCPQRPMWLHYQVPYQNIKIINIVCGMWFLLRYKKFFKSA